MKAIKKFYITLISTVICCTSVYAQDGYNVDEPITDESVYYTNYYLNIANDESLPDHINPEQRPVYNTFNFRRASLAESAWASDGVGFYSQEDCSHVPCGQSGNLAMYGCAITGISMMLQKYGVYKDPEAAYYDMRARGVVDGSCYTDFSRVGSVFGRSSTYWTNAASGFKESVGLDIIEGVLKTGNPVLVGMKRNDGTSGSHYVVVIVYEHYSDGGEFHYIRNPSKSTDKQETLQQYMVGPWYIYDFTTISY